MCAAFFVINYGRIDRTLDAAMCETGITWRRCVCIARVCIAGGGDTRARGKYLLIYWDWIKEKARPPVHNTSMADISFL